MSSNSEFKDTIDIYSFGLNEKAALLQEIVLPNNSSVKVYLKREDLIHPTVSGNKWRKLKYNLIEAKKQNKKTLLTFGGAYSNHIHSTANAGKIFGFNTIGIIRGEEHLPLNYTLQNAKDCGMEIHYLDRVTYRTKDKQLFIDKLIDQFGDFYLLPEGGTNNLAIKGCTEILSDIDIEFDHLLSACGTGGTISGLICGLNGIKNVIGVPVLKGAQFLINDIENFTKGYSGKTFNNWSLNLTYHMGGYAKINKELVVFIKEFEETNNIQLDPVYTGKLLFGLNSMIISNKFNSRDRIIAIHTGGLQGNEGMKNKIKKLLS